MSATSGLRVLAERGRRVTSGRGYNGPDRRNRDEDALPVKFRVLAIGTLIGLLIVHVLLDVFLPYDGRDTSLMIGGIVGTALGLNEFVRGRGGGRS